MVLAGWAGYSKFFGSEATAKSDTPRIAVLAFDNLSGDPSLGSFADGLSEALITDLAEFGLYDVLARNTTFAYKGHSVDVPAIGRKLGADYVLEGSVRGAGDKLEVTAQLIDARTGAHVWAKSYPEPASAERGVFLNDTARTIAVAVGDIGSGAIPARAVETSRDKAPEALTPFECIATARSLDNVTQSPVRVRACLESTVKRDPNNADAWAVLSESLREARFWGVGLPPDEAQDVDKRAYLVAPLVEAARKAVALAPNRVNTHRAMAGAFYAACEKDRLRVETERVIALSPNDIDAQGLLGNFNAFAGNWEFGRQLSEKAIAAEGPSAPSWWYWSPAKADYHKGDYEKAYRNFLLAYRDGSWLDLLHVVYTLPYLGRTEEAKARVPELIKLKPDISVKVANQYYKMLCFDDDFVARMDKALRMAGLREAADAPPAAR